ncbi:hypothetical protein, partial [Paracraurococcus ruber]|uniref:hypothetical protein n=1 Tax=Paracraurococcus ruber TaxID=77675 RepID=UPI001305310C
ATEALTAALAAAPHAAAGLDGPAAASGEFRALLRVIGESRLLGPAVRDAVLRDAEAAIGLAAASPVQAVGIGPLTALAPERNRVEPTAAAARLQAQ